MRLGRLQREGGFTLETHHPLGLLACCPTPWQPPLSTFPTVEGPWETDGATADPFARLSVRRRWALDAPHAAHQKQPGLAAAQGIQHPKDRGLLPTC